MKHRLRLLRSKQALRAKCNLDSRKVSLTGRYGAPSSALGLLRDNDDDGARTENTPRVLRVGNDPAFTDESE